MSARKLRQIYQISFVYILHTRIRECAQFIRRGLYNASGNRSIPLPECSTPLGSGHYTTYINMNFFQTVAVLYQLYSNKTLGEKKSLEMGTTQGCCCCMLFSTNLGSCTTLQNNSCMATYFPSCKPSMLDEDKLGAAGEVRTNSYGLLHMDTPGSLVEQHQLCAHPGCRLEDLSSTMT